MSFFDVISRKSECYYIKLDEFDQDPLRKENIYISGTIGGFKKTSISESLQG